MSSHKDSDVGSDSREIEQYHGFDEEADNRVRDLARTLTNASEQRSHASESLIRRLSHMSHASSHAPGVEPFLGDIDERLDPNSDMFDSRFWIKNVRSLHDANQDYYKPTKLGIAYRDLRAYGIATDSDYQPTVTTAWFKMAVDFVQSFRKRDPSVYFDILKSMDAIMRPGELTVVLGRPGSGCSTLLKTIAAHTYGFHISEESKITYDGLSVKDVEKHFRGDVIYSAETDVHFPHLSVGDTLEFAARLRTPQNRGNVDRESYARHVASVVMATFGLSHTRNTAVGNDFIRGVSGGERKRVLIAEAALCGANLQCWDNATRGLDSATALEFIRALKACATVVDATPLIAIYQCSQDAYDLFDNVVLLYEGRQIFFGKADAAKGYFMDMGYDCPQRQTTADFLTSLTNPAERIVFPGYEDKVPRTPVQFEEYWKKSPQYAALVKDIDEHMSKVASTNNRSEYHESHVARQSRHISPKSPYIVSFFMQTRYIMGRNILRTKGDPSIPLFSIFIQLVMGLILSSIFYNLDQTTGSFFSRGSALFFAVLFNAFASLLEIMSLYEARPIVEKHKKYALYRPAADALASVITELPVKLVMSMSFNFVFYFMVNLRRNPGHFFFYWLMCSLCTLVMSHIFRSLGAMTTTLAGAMTPATVILLAMVIFTGFVIPTPKMLGWSRWINYINPVGYVFESLMANEFSGREFECAQFVPSGGSYSQAPLSQRLCNTVGLNPGTTIVSGSRYIGLQYSYYAHHKWRDFGIVIAFVIVFLFVYVWLTEINKGSMQKGEIVLFLRGSLKKHKRENAARQSQAKDLEAAPGDEKVGVKEHLSSEKEDSDDTEKLPANSRIFHWRNLTYQVKIKTEDRVILNHVDGWVKPGQLTALMGSSGAGKTTLLNCLSERLTTGVVSDGTRMVNGRPLDSSFQRSIGYVQQQDLHLPMSTVREALTFSAYLRQPNSTSKASKDLYVEYIIDLLDMNAYADALVGVAGEGLNVEQRKRLTIGVELVAKPKLLLFLDEPTSGLDSQTAWSICQLMRKLADRGQAILCTIHQPSAILLKEFDRLLFLQKGGQTVYFGDLGENSSTLINYFEKYGADPCPKEANPAEWMLLVVGAAPGSHAKQDYYEVWRNSEEFKEVNNELDRMESELVKLPVDDSPEAHKSYAAPIWKQYYYVTLRVILQDWRTPGYIYSKLFLGVSSSLFNGFSFFKANKSIQGLQNQMFSVFMYLVPFNTLVQQMLEYFVHQREVYEVREAPSKTFSWFAFILGQITSEFPYQIAVGTIAFFCWYYPVGLYQNAVPTDTVHERGAYVWLLLTAFYVYTSTMGQMCNSFIELKDNAANLATLLFTMCLSFCGVLATKDAMPGFWIFMYRCNPFTYLIQGVLSASLAHSDVKCAEQEFLKFEPPSGYTCQQYMEGYIKAATGYLKDENATSQCHFCPMSSTDTFLASINSVYSERWRNFGIYIAFIGVNVILTVGLYWWARVPKGTRQKKTKK